MRRNLVDADISTQFPGLYRPDILRERIKDLGISKLEAARRANVKPETLRRVLAGKASRKTVWPVSQVLGLDWSMIHNLDLKLVDFHLAVRGGSPER